MKKNTKREAAKVDEWDVKVVMDAHRKKKLEEVKRLHEAGNTPTEIANFFNVSRQRAHQLLAEAGCK